MKHYMNLWNDSFQAIKEGKKTIEMRLNDEKRSIIMIDDLIEFTNTKTNEVMTCKVSNLFFYKNFEELYMNHKKVSLGYKENETANPSDMYMYYSKEKIAKYGVIGIEIVVI
ncbi:MAG: ASCH domain-containing protein [Erysipelotrichaceae bacterium]|nr:ASCH domain-containing protein [Erysipelotrichaceae bacterium]